jgi:hypothetical protein
MYEVQVYVPSEPFDVRKPSEPGWKTHTVIEQLESEQAELKEARDTDQVLREFYKNVRIMEWLPGGEAGRVVT